MTMTGQRKLPKVAVAVERCAAMLMLGAQECWTRTSDRCATLARVTEVDLSPRFSRLKLSCAALARLRSECAKR